VSGAASLQSSAEAVAIVRRSMLGVRAGASSGTGWVALGNGLVMTSHEAVGFEPSVTLVLDGGRRTEGRVIWVDSARDLALVMPSERLSLPPLFPRPDLPRLGEAVLALSAAPEGPWRVVSGVVSAVDVRIGQLRCFEIDAEVASRGGPIVDLDGRIIGVGGLDLPRGSARRATSTGTPTRSLAIPISALSRALAAVDIAPQQFEGRTPIYRCPTCTEPFAPRDERCGACGRLLPHAWGLRDPSGRSAPAEKMVQDWVGELGPGSAVARVAPRTFRLVAPGEGGLVDVTVEIDPEGALLRGKVPVAPIPTANLEPFYRFLLTVNDSAPGSLRFSVEDDTVFLSFAEPVSSVRPGEGSRYVQDLLRESERYRRTLRESFDVEPASSR
jgi:hypothetical protein